MNIANDHVVEINYTLKNEQGSVIDSSKGKDPLKYLHGKNMLVPSLEKEISGKEIGDKLSVTIKAIDGYGEKREDLIQKVPKTQFGNSEKIVLGSQFETQTPEGENILLTVVKIKDDHVIVDANHPLAGVDLYFDVEVMSIRDATKDELAHGHPHLEGGCGGHS